MSSPAQYIDDTANKAIATYIADALRMVNNTLSISGLANQSGHTSTMQVKISDHLLGPINDAASGIKMRSGVHYTKMKSVLREAIDFLETDTRFGKSHNTYKMLATAAKNADDSETFWDWVAEHQTRPAVSMSR